MTSPRPRSYRLDRNIAWLTRRRDAVRKCLSKLGPVVDGSLVLIARTCGNSAHCRCSRGVKHVNTYLSYAVKGKTRMVYIPVDLEREVRRWSGDYRKLRDWIREICALQKAMIRRHVQERRRQR